MSFIITWCFKKIYRCVQPPPPFEARDVDTVVDEEEAPDDDDDADDLNDKKPRNEMEADNREEERHIDESSLQSTVLKAKASRS